MKGLRRLLSGMVLAIAITALVFPAPVFAAITDGRGSYGDCGDQMMRAYFANVCGDPYIDHNGDSGFVMPRRFVDGALHSALYGVDTKAELYNYLVGANGLTSSREQSRVGAAFIIHTMLGRSGSQANSNGGKTISSADRSALYQALVQNPDIVMSVGSYSNRFNSGSRLVNGNIDESFFDSSLGGGSVANVSALILRKASTGAIVYTLERLCANPMGDSNGLAGLDLPWNSTASIEMREVSTVSPSTPIAGGTIGDTSITGQVNHRYGWFWSVRNNGPDATNVSVMRQRSWTFPSPYGSSSWVAAGINRAAGVAAGSNIFNYSNFGYTPTIQPSDAGKTFCMRIRYDPSNLIGTMWTSPNYCVTIAYDYNLIPSVTMSSTTAEIGGTPPTTSYSVRNDGPSVSQSNQFTVKQFVVQPGQTVASGMRDNVAGNCGIPSSVSACATDVYTSPTGIIFNVGTTNFTVGPNNVATNTYNIPPLTQADMNQPAGSQVCRVLHVVRATESVTNRWGSPTCVTIGKKPHMSILNGDAWAGGNFLALDTGSDGEACTATGTQAGGLTGAYSTYSGASYGSYGEYQLFGIGPITNFASGGKVTEPLSGLLSASLTYKGPSLAALGRFYDSTTSGITDLTSHCISDATGFYTNRPAVATFGSATLGLGNFPSSGVYRSTGDLTLNTMTIPAGRHIVIIVAGRTVINGNITLASGPYADISQIPSFTLITGTNTAAADKDIEIASAVTQVDGLYQTYGNFVTCRESISGGIGVNSAVCKEQLVVNGSVIANKLVLRRIKGADQTDRATPAEIFRLRPDIFLSGYGDAQTGTQLRTTSEQELPPRY